MEKGNDDTKELSELANVLNINKKSEIIKDSYKFWDTQPVPSFKSEKNNSFIGPIDKIKTIDDIKKEPFNLPNSFEWVDIDINCSTDLNILYEFLRDHYVEDDEGMFRFDYSKKFLKWHLTAPNYKKELHIGVFYKSKEGCLHF